MRSLVVPSLIVAALCVGACRNRIGPPSGSSAYPGAPSTMLAPAYEAQVRQGQPYRAPPPPAAPRASSTQTATPATAPRALPAPSAGGGVFAENPSFDQLLARARSAGKPVFLYFETTRCGWCDRLKRDTFSQGAVQARLRSGFVAARYDAGLPTGRALADRYGMPGYPVMVVADASGREIGRVVGYRDANALIGELAGY